MPHDLTDLHDRLVGRYERAKDMAEHASPRNREQWSVDTAYWTGARDAYHYALVVVERFIREQAQTNQSTI